MVRLSKLKPVKATESSTACMLRFKRIRGRVKDTDPVSEATIQSKNFTRRDATSRGMVLAKTVVVLRKQADDSEVMDPKVQVLTRRNRLEKVSREES